jgi:hypothetical protein
MYTEFISAISVGIQRGNAQAIQTMRQLNKAAGIVVRNPSQASAAALGLGGNLGHDDDDDGDDDDDDDPRAPAQRNWSAVFSAALSRAAAASPASGSRQSPIVIEDSTTQPQRHPVLPPDDAKIQRAPSSTFAAEHEPDSTPTTISSPSTSAGASARVLLRNVPINPDAPGYNSDTDSTLQLALGPDDNSDSEDDGGAALVFPDQTPAAATRTATKPKPIVVVQPAASRRPRSRQALQRRQQLR